MKKIRTGQVEGSDGGENYRKVRKAQVEGSTGGENTRKVRAAQVEGPITGGGGSPPPTTSSRSRNMDDYAWTTGTTVVTDAWLDANATLENGKYVVRNRYFRSLSAGQNAIQIRTSRVVRFEGCGFYAVGSFSNPYSGIILTMDGNALLEVFNSLFWSGRLPVDGSYPARAVNGQYPKRIIVERCELRGTSGIGVQSFFGDRTGAVPTIKVTRNKFVGLDGRVSKADGQPRTGNRWGNGSSADFIIANVLQLDSVQNVPNVEVSFNDVVCTVHDSRYEDVVSFARSSGTPNSPVYIYRNLFRGGYVYDPAFDANTSEYHGNNMPIPLDPGAVGHSGDIRGYVHSGGGGLLGDGRGDDYTTDPAYTWMEDNYVLDQSNYGVGIAAGHDHTLKGNKVYRSGFVHGLTRAVKVAWGHVAVQIQDYYTGGGLVLDDGAGSSRPRWFNNDAIDNEFGYVYFDPRDGQTKTAGLLANSPLRTNSGNTSVPAATVTRAFVDAKEQELRAKWAAAGITVGIVE